MKIKGRAAACSVDRRREERPVDRRERTLWLRGIAAENERLLEQGWYETAGVRHAFSPRIRECVRFPAAGHEALIAEEGAHRTDRAADLRVVSGDTMAHAEEAVLNFADAFTPGGSYLAGSAAQEECLCRESTLYASLTSEAAAPMYEANCARGGPEDDTFLFTPAAEIFRAPMEEGYALLPEPRTCAVITCAAPDLSSSSRHLPPAAVREIVRRRMRAMLAAAHRQGCRTLTLGAWGCGVFGHDAAVMAEDFRTVLVGERWQSLFRRITFAVYGEDAAGRYNLAAFRRTFAP